MKGFMAEWNFTSRVTEWQKIIAIFVEYLLLF